MQFFPFFLFGQNKTRNKVYDVLDRKESFYDNKTTIFPRLKNGSFPKGLTLHLVKKCNFFLDLFSVKTRLEIRFNDVLDRQVQKSDRINSDRQSGSDQLGSTRTNSDRIKK